MVTTSNLETADEELKITASTEHETKRLTATNIHPQINKALRSSFNESSAKNQKIQDKQINFGFNSFIGSGNTPQDLKVQTAKKVRLGNGNASAKQSFVVSEKHLFSTSSQQSNTANPMRDRLMTEFLKTKIGQQRFEKVEKLLQNEPNPIALLKKPTQELKDALLGEGGDQSQLKGLLRMLERSHVIKSGL